jgi:hypothetical protein
MTDTASRAKAAGRRSQLGRAAVVVVALLAAAALGLLASACGGDSSSDGVAQVDTTDTTTTGSETPDGSGSADPAAYSACMRENGVPNFPDPESDGGFMLNDAGIDGDSPQFEAAAKACRESSPAAALSAADRAEFREQALTYAACMRENGVTDFPDPQGDELLVGRGADENSPQFQEASEACEELLPGRPGSVGGEEETP